MSEELDAIDDELLAAIAKVKGHAVQKAEPQPVSKIYPVSAAVKKAEEEILRNAVPGQKMPDGTVYVGKYSPVDRKGKSLSREFNVFAMAEDLPGGTRTYVDTVDEVSRLKAHGYSGASYANDTEFYEALRKGDYNGEWIIPTKDILHGRDFKNEDTTPDNIFANKDEGAFKGTFKTAHSDNNGGYPDFYWSFTEVCGNSQLIYDILFSGDRVDEDPKDSCRLSCRPVRLVPCP